MALSGHWENLRTNFSDLEKHDTVKKTMLDDFFWNNVKRILKITKPIYMMLRFCDSDKPVIGEVYEQMDTMLGKIKDILVNDPTVYNLIHQLVVKIRDKMNIPLHCLAYVLVPKYYTYSWLSKPALGGVRRTKPHFDVEVQKGYLDTIEKMIYDLNEATKIRHQISDFVSDSGPFARPHTVKDRETMSAVSWWHMYGGVTLELYLLALKVLSQDVNTACAERCWSTYFYIQNVERNRLHCDRAEKLVFVHYNQRLLSRYRVDYKSFKDWDIHDNNVNIEEALPTVKEREDAILSDSENKVIQDVTATSGGIPSGSASTGPTTSTRLQTPAEIQLEKPRRKRQNK